MSRIIVTAGDKWADMDVLGCAVAYAELLRLEGKDGVTVISGAFTISVTPSILAWKGEYETTHQPEEGNTFVMVDISEPEHFPAFVDPARVIEIYDHRYGFEEYWHNTLGENTHIEMVGSCATLIWEQFVLRDVSQKISEVSAKLLLAAIVSNTLNFKASVTHERDILAYEALKLKTGLTDEWVRPYFKEQEDLLLNDIKTSLTNDTKVQALKDGSTIVIGQLELWNANGFVDVHKEVLRSVLMTSGNEEWCMNLPSIEEGKNYIYTESAKAKRRLEEKLGVTFDGDIAETPRLMLRKEVTKALNS